jgi:hypothetical protein
MPLLGVGIGYSLLLAYARNMGGTLNRDKGFGHYKEGVPMTRTKCMVMPIAILIGGMVTGTFSEGGFLQNNVSWMVQAGAYHGSIVVHNNVDAVSGATKTSVCGSAAAEFKVANHYISAGVNIAQVGQNIDYKDTVNGITGERDISLLLLDLPLLYNFHLFTKPSSGRDNPRLILSLDGFMSFVLSKQESQTGAVKPEKMSSWALGPYLRIVGYPFSYGRFQPGLYLDFYRSFIPTFYDEPYFKQNSISGQLGILSGGLSFRF